MKVVIVDDHAIFRKAVIAILKQSPYVASIYEAGNYHELFKILEVKDPDLIILDLELPGMDGIEICQHLFEENARQKILILTMYDSNDLMAKLITMGVNGHLVKGSEPSEILNAIKVLQDHDIYYTRKIVDILRNTVLNQSRILDSTSTKLSQKELKVLGLVCKEYTSQEIASAMKLSLRAVEKIRSNLIKKTDSKNVVGLIKYAYQHKLLILGS